VKIEGQAEASANVNVFMNRYERIKSAYLFIVADVNEHQGRMMANTYI